MISNQPASSTARGPSVRSRASVAALSLQGVAAPQPASTVFRNDDLCLAWSLASTACIAALVLGNLSAETSLAAATLALYALQGLIVEVVGVRVGGRALRLPWRPISRAPLLSFWTRTIPLGAVESLVVVPGGRALRVHSSLGAVEIRLASREARREFTQKMRRARPEISIYRR